MTYVTMILEHGTINFATSVNFKTFDVNLEVTTLLPIG